MAKHQCATGDRAAGVAPLNDPPKLGVAHLACWKHSAISLQERVEVVSQAGSTLSSAWVRSAARERLGRVSSPAVVTPLGRLATACRTPGPTGSRPVASGGVVGFPQINCPSRDPLPSDLATSARLEEPAGSLRGEQSLRVRGCGGCPLHRRDSGIKRAARLRALACSGCSLFCFRRIYVQAVC